MKRLLSIVLTIVILLQTLSSLVIVSGYEANKSFISTYLCENKNKPQLHCNGQCYLMKQLKKEASEQEQKANNSLREKFEINLFAQSETPNFIDNTYIKLTQEYFFLQKEPIKSSITIYHPPQV
ncbi:hypothetical protein NF867_13695 [Solitalea sp. MAHUQ-68]|uniref:Uncharacterized protein n=1 Tax=Solitalea agri TaxID=2953739 RepID=A0A9X2F8X7_9SPHI|nr:hypothetical protein [Solitalea agri]MCO4293913.1 hypothetical protein [Solitalea agri]